jgi:hypothetical protein
MASTSDWMGEMNAGVVSMGTGGREKSNGEIRRSILQFPVQPILD